MAPHTFHRFISSDGSINGWIDNEGYLYNTYDKRPTVVDWEDHRMSVQLWDLPESPWTIEAALAEAFIHGPCVDYGPGRKKK